MPDDTGLPESFAWPAVEFEPPHWGVSGERGYICYPAEEDGLRPTPGRATP